MPALVRAILLCVALGLPGVIAAIVARDADDATVSPEPPTLVAPTVVVEMPAPPVPIIDDTLRADEALSTALSRHGVTADDISALVRSLKPHIEPRALRAGAPFSLEVERSTGALVRFEMRTLSSEGVPRIVRAERKPPPITAPEDGPSYVASHEDAPIETRLEGLAGVVRSSLYQSMLEAGEEPALVDKFVDVFAWNIDFYRQTQRGDEWRVLVEKKRAGGRFIGYGRVLAAEYVNAGTAHRGFLFTSKDGRHAGTYDDAGNALQRTFLKNPMEIARITSSYGMRFHPVLGHNKKHDGIDYGAPTGTPVWSVADGVVKEARYSKTAGNMIVVQHMNGITTEYFHLSKFAEGVKPGARVKQKQVIGYVGSTGLSTGPHLHFGMLRNGSHVDPAKQKFPNARPVPKEFRDEFDAFVAPLLAELKALDRA